MNNSGVAISYGDVAPEAKENFKPETSSQEYFVNLSQLQEYNLSFPNYANPCELYSVMLDGEASAFPSVPEAANLGLWSAQLSNADGTFTDPIVLALTSEGKYSSQGFTLTFDTYNQIYATRVNIKWYRDGEIITDDEGNQQDKYFSPDNAFYFCRNFVENYDKVVITFYSINMPGNRLKLRVIDYGYGTIFYGDELRNVKCIQEINPISTEISINTADFTLDSKSDMEYSFQTKQPLSIYFNGELKATTFVKSSKRKARYLWEIQSEDYIGLMDSIPYYGGIYNNANAVDIIKDIFNDAKVPFEIDEIFAEETVTGHIPYTTCRDALMQVAFAIQAAVSTSNYDVVKVYALADSAASEPIPLDRIMQGQSFTDDETVTGVELTVHTYTPLPEEERDYLYKAEDSGMGENIFVSFSEPQQIDTIAISKGEILEKSANHAVINALEGCQLWGQGYAHRTTTKRKNLDTLLASQIEKIVTVQNATLISSMNADKVLVKAFEWLTRVNSTNLKIIEGKHVSGGEWVVYGQVKYGQVKYGGTTPKEVSYDEQVNVGEIVTCQTEYLGEVTGRIIKETFNLNGGTIVKEAVLK